MNGRAFAGWILRGIIATLIVGVTSLGAVTQSATYFGVTFPNGDLAFADRVVDYVAASCVRDAYDDPVEALGPPDACPSGCQGCNGCDTNAVSLGFRLSASDTRGYLIIEFVDNVLIDAAGDDLFIYITNDNPARVEISSDGRNYVFVGETVGYPGAIDISPYVGGGEQFRFVRLEDVPADEDHSACPGASIDAIGAMGPTVQAATGEAFGSLELQPVGELDFAFQFSPATYYIILDTSSSMGDRIDGQLKLDVAKDVIIEFLSALGQDTMVGIRTFGGCGHSELISSVGPLQFEVLETLVQQLEPGGATPIDLALREAKEDLLEIAGRQLVLLVSDGMQTCEGDPIEAARELADSGLDVLLNVVGFDIAQDPQAREQLMAIAQACDGLYCDAADSQQLRQAVRSITPFFYTVFDEAGSIVFEGRIGQDGPSLPAGTYTVVIDAEPPITLENVVVQDQLTTRISVEQQNGGFRAEVE